MLKTNLADTQGKITGAKYVVIEGFHNKTFSASVLSETEEYYNIFVPYDGTYRMIYKSKVDGYGNTLGEALMMASRLNCRSARCRS